MKKKYQLNARVRAINWVVQSMIRLGLGPKSRYLLSVRGRKSGRWFTTPVAVVQEGHDPWLVAPYGEVNWVRNARVGGRVRLARGGRSEEVMIEQAPPEERARVLKEYLPIEPITQSYFEARPDSPLQDFLLEVPRHPVFHLKTAQT